MPDLIIRPGHPDFLDLPWEVPLDDWTVPHLVDLPKGISRHTVRFVAYPAGLYAVKELARASARRDYEVLRILEPRGAPVVSPVGLVENRHADHTDQVSAALITKYVNFSFSYREILAGPGFGRRRDKMADAVAGLLVELHLAGCFWGDCSLSNVLYRWDADAIETIMVDAETAELHEELTEGQREEDLAIMEVNVAGGMADIAAEMGTPLDDADLTLGTDIADRYRGLWTELVREEVVAPDERYRINDRIARLNELGFAVDEIDLVPAGAGDRLRIKVKVGGRTFHRERLRNLTGVEALEGQARQILSDVYYHQAAHGESSEALKTVSAVQWRVSRLEPMLARLAGVDGVVDPVQAYCDLLHHRYVASVAAGYDVGTEAAFESWMAAGRPGFLPEIPEDGDLP